MADTFQDEVSRARTNVMLVLHAREHIRKLNCRLGSLLLAILVMTKNTSRYPNARKSFPITNFDSVLSEFIPNVYFASQTRWLAMRNILRDGISALVPR